MRLIPRRRLDPVRECARCNLQTSEKNTECVHCSDLSEIELQSLLEQHQASLEANAHLGKYFGLAAVIILALMILNSFNI
jgi:hypothetical protein